MKKKMILQLSAGLVTTGLVFTGYTLIRNKKRDAFANKLLAALSPKLSGASKRLSNEKAFDVNYTEKVVNTIPSRIVLLKKSLATSYAKGIHKGFIPWYQGGDDEAAIYYVFKSLKDKVQVSQVAKAYEEEFGKNLQDKLQDKFDKDEIQKVLQIISRLPDYRKI